MKNIRISQKTAILIERLLNRGCLKEQLIKKVQLKDSSFFSQYSDEDYSFETFLSYAAEHQEDIAGAIQHGYQMTFNTMGGLRYWLENAFGLEEEIDYFAEEGKKLGLKIANDQLEKLRQALATNWVVVEKDNQIDLIHISLWTHR